MGKLLITLVVAAVGGLVGVRLRIPAGALLGAMIAVGAYNIASTQVYVPAAVKIVAQILAGAVIGVQINRDTIVGFKDLALPAIILVLGMFFVNLAVGLLIARVSKLDLVTSLFASSPGGITEMTLAAQALGADTPKVALLQSLRLISIISFMPIVLRYFVRVFGR
ncbi:MAG: AbrB family transcriptional regulator [Clostridia bacterium]|nr:AbrB family transcriptional regulator [Clostridia bacterium]